MKSLQTPHIVLFNHYPFMEEISDFIVDGFSLSHSGAQHIDYMKWGQRKQCFGIFSLCESQGTEGRRVDRGVRAV